jgi:hypothetical protein
MYMKKIWKKCFRQKKQLFLLLLLTVIQCKQRYSGGQNKVGQVLLRNLAKIELSKPGLL